MRRMLLVFTAAMVMALMMVAMALPVFAGGDEEDKDNDSGGSTRNGQIVFRRYFDPDHTKGALFTMNPDGSHIRQITHPPKGWRDDSPVWSPDGTKVAFYRQRIDESMSRIMVINPDTGDVREVTHCGPDHGYPGGIQLPLGSAWRTSNPPGHQTVIRWPSIASSAPTPRRAFQMESGSSGSTGAILIRSPRSIRSPLMRLRSGGRRSRPTGRC